jgi:hypothetical protein
MVDCAGVGILCGILLSSSITQSALPAVSACVASNKNLFTVLAAVMVNVRAALVPPPGAGENTVTVAVPAVVILVAGTMAVSEVELTKLVVSAVPFHLITELLIKLLPVAVNVNAGLPAVMVEGEMLLNTGTGLLLIVNVNAPEVPTPLVATVILAVPAVAISAAGTVAVSEVGLTKLVLSAVPFQLTVDVLVKLVPVAVSEKDGPPAVAELGETEVSVGGLVPVNGFTVKSSKLMRLVPPSVLRN